MKNKLMSILCALAAGLTLAPGALAKGPSGSSSSLKLVLLNSTDGLPHYGQTITFNVSTTATDQPYVRLNCYQNGLWLYTSNVGFFPSWPWSDEFYLGNGNWTSGAADCTATLYAVTKTNKEQDLAALSFHVYA